MMLKNTFTVSGIPAVLWGAPSDRVFIHVHGKMSRKEHAEPFAAIAGEKGAAGRATDATCGPV